MWILYALTQAIVGSFSTILSKSLSKNIHYAVLPIGQLLAGWPFLALAFLWYGPVRVESWFWIGVFVTSILNVIAFLLAFKTLVMEEVSFLAPVIAINPLITVIFSFFTLGEVPSLTALIGIVFIGIGASFLGREGRELPHRSLARFFRRRSVQFVVVAQVIWAITPTFEKLALIHMTPTNPAALPLATWPLIALGIMPFAWYKTKSIIKPLINIWPSLVLIGFFMTIGTLAAFTAFLQTNVAYVTAVMRTSMFFTMLLAKIFLHERISWDRLGAVVFMFSGIVLLAY